MLVADKLLEKTLHWGPLFVGLISLITGIIVIKSHDPSTTTNNQSFILDQFATQSSGFKQPLSVHANRARAKRMHSHSIKLGARAGTVGRALTARLSKLKNLPLQHRIDLLSVSTKVRLIGKRGAAASLQGLKQFEDFLNEATARSLAIQFSQPYPSLKNGVHQTVYHSQQTWLSKQAQTFTSPPKTVLVGLNTSLKTAQFLKHQHRARQFGQILATKARLKSYQGGIRLSESGHKYLALITAKYLKPVPLPPSAFQMANIQKTIDKSACGTRYYAALKNLHQQKIASLRKTVRPLSLRDKSLPGKWIFPALGRPKKKHCVKYKRYKSGYKKCLKWRLRPMAGEAWLERSKLQDDFFALAAQLVRNKGRHPAFKPKSSNYWVVNRVAQDLNSYVRQQDNPALCTGAIGLVSFYEQNLKRIKNHINKVTLLNENSQAIVQIYYHRLHNLLTGSPIDHLKHDQDLANFPEKQTNMVANANPHLKLDPTAQINHRSFHLSTDLHSTVLASIKTVFNHEAAKTIAARRNFIAMLRETRKIYLKKRRTLQPELAQALNNFYRALEASYYIQRTNQQNKRLSQHLFGSLDAIRTAHNTHCRCK